MPRRPRTQSGRFKPEHLGKLEFYLEALDRDLRKPHERPSIGLLLCATKDTEGRVCPQPCALPAMIAEYAAMLPDKELLRAKLHEFYQLLAPAEPEGKVAASALAQHKRKRAAK